MENYHITKDGDKQQLKKQGAARASKTAGTKDEIIQEARKYMSSRTGSVKIHKVDGKIQEERTYPRKADPKKSPG